MESSRIESDDNRMLMQVVHTSKNLLVCGNLLDRGVVGTTSLRGRSAKVRLPLTPMW
jgi:hypothetical protein